MTRFEKILILLVFRQPCRDFYRGGDKCASTISGKSLLQFC